MMFMTLELKDIFIVTVSALIGCILGCMLEVIIIKKVFPAPQIATVDIQALMMRASNRLSLQNIPEADLKARVSAFTDQLKSELQTLASQKKLIILNAQGVLEGAQDLTALIEENLNREDRQ